MSWAIVFTLLALIIGCGGGGGGGGTSGTGTTSGALHTPEITAYQGASGGQMLDTRDVLVGQTIQLDITARDVNNNLVIVPISGWSTNAPSSVATLTASGVLTAVGPSGFGSYSIKVIYGGVLYSATLVVKQPADLLTGTVRNETAGIQQVVLDFYDAKGSQVGVAYTARDGSFLASVPSTATRFTIDMSLADPNGTSYYSEFAYSSASYLSGTGCLAKLPTPLSATAPTALPTPVVVYLRSGGPPPPPTGCIG